MEGNLFSQIQNEGETEYVNGIYSNNSHAKIRDAILPQIKVLLADKSDELKQAVFENYQEFLSITRALEEIEQDFLKIHTQFSSMGSELDELNQHFASELNEQQVKLHKLMDEKSNIIKVNCGRIDDEKDSDKKEILQKVSKLRDNIVFILDAPVLLEVHLSQWNFDQCICILDKVNNIMKEEPILKTVLKGHAALQNFDKMIDIIIQKLQKRLLDLSLSSKQTRLIIEHLKKVTTEEKAMMILLDSKAKTAKDRVLREMQVPNISILTQNVCAFIFPLIRNTWVDFSASFGTDGNALSCIMAWNVSLLNYTLELLEKRISNKDNKQNTVKVECIMKINALYKVNIPQELSLPFIVRKYLSNIVKGLSKSKEDDDRHIIQQLNSIGFTPSF